MADWHRRSKTSLRRRKTKRPNTTSWMDILRKIAWPIGEERELLFWGEVFETIPTMAMIAGFSIGISWMFTSPLYLETTELNVFERALWEGFCGSVHQSQIGVMCSSYQWLPGCISLWTFSIGFLFNKRSYANVGNDHLRT